VEEEKRGQMVQMDPLVFVYTPLKLQDVAEHQVALQVIMKLDTVETVAAAAKHILADGVRVAHKIGSVGIVDKMFPLLEAQVEREEMVVKDRDTQLKVVLYLDLMDP